MRYPREMALTIVAAVLTLPGPLPVHAGGAVRDPGTRGATPAPLQQSRLVLEREEVVFRNGEITARFRVGNPAGEDLRVTMGFPVDYADRERAALAVAAESLDNDPGGPFHVTVDDGENTAVRIKDDKSSYPLLHVWEMTFPAGVTREFAVSYPMRPSMTEEGGKGSIRKSEFIYATHAAGYADTPVQRARFEYCDAQLVRAMARFPAGNFEGWSDDGLRVGYREWRIAPVPYLVDGKKGCVVWEREEWRPRKVRDDIRVYLEESSQGFGFSCTKEDCNGLAPMQTIWDNWCGSGDVGHRRHFGETVNISTQELGADITRLEFLAYRHSHDLSAASDPQIYLPEHLETDFQLALLRYLRNYIAAVHGHSFRDRQLAACYGNVRQIPEWTPADRKNLAVIRSLESSIKKKNAIAWKIVRDNPLRAE